MAGRKNTQEQLELDLSKKQALSPARNSRRQRTNELSEVVSETDNRVIKIFQAKTGCLWRYRGSYLYPQKAFFVEKLQNRKHCGLPAYRLLYSLKAYRDGKYYTLNKGEIIGISGSGKCGKRQWNKRCGR